MRPFLSIAFAFTVPTAALADFDYADFSSVVGLQLNGTARQTGDLVRMTDDGIMDQAGNMWRTDLQSVGNGFTSTFRFRCDGDGESPADGMAFGIQATGVDEMGNAGGDNAMVGLSGSVVVNFQSFWDKVQIIAVDGSGSVLSFAEADFAGLHRSTPWTAEVGYDAAAQGWTVKLDGSTVLSLQFDLVQAVGSGDAYVGLGAATGLGFDNNDALSWRVQTVPEPSTLAVLAFGASAALKRRRYRS